MDVFTLKGSVEIDTSGAESKLNAISQKAQTLKKELDELNSGGGTPGYTGNPPVYTSTTIPPVLALPPATTNTNRTTTGTTTTTGTGTTGTGTTTPQPGSYAATVAPTLAGKKFGFGTVGAVYLGQALWRMTERAAGAAVSFGKKGISYNETMEKYEKMIGSYLNEDDPAKVKEFVNSLVEFAVDTPLSLEGTMMAAVKTLQSGVDPENLIETLRMLGDLALGDTSKMESLAYVYGQVMAGGKLQGDDYRQFKNAFVNIHDLLATYYSEKEGVEVTAADVMERQSAGTVTAEDVHNAMMLATQEGGPFYNKMAVMMATLFGQKQKLSDLYDQTTGAVMAEPTDVMKEQILPGLAEVLTEVKTWAEENPETLRDAAEGVGSTVVELADTVADFATGAAEFYSENREATDAGLLLGGLALLKTAHPVLGAASLLFGYGDTKNQLKEHGEKLYEESMSPDEGINSSVVRLTMPDDLEEKLDNGVAYEDLSEEEKRHVDRAKIVAGLEQRLLDLHDNSPLGKAAQMYEISKKISEKTVTLEDLEKYGIKPTPEVAARMAAEEERRALKESGGSTTADGIVHTADEDQNAFLLEAQHSFSGWNSETIAEMERMWDAYRDAALNGGFFDSSDYLTSMYNAMYSQLAEDGMSKKDIPLTTIDAQDLFWYYIQRLSLDNEDLPVEWFSSPPGSSGSGGNPYDFPAPISSAVNTALIAALQGITQAYNPDAIAAAVESAIIRGMSGVTIEQGNVVLNTGSLVGTLTPILNQKFGALLGRASRG